MTDALLLCILSRGLIQRESQHFGLYQCVQRGVALADTHGAADFLRITIRPRSSIRRTIPVAFIYKFLRCLKITAFLPVVVLSVFSVELFMRFRQKMRTTSKNGMLEIHVSLCYNQISLLWEPLKTDKNAVLKLIIAVVVLIIGVYSMPSFVSTVQMWF